MHLKIASFCHINFCQNRKKALWLVALAACSHSKNWLPMNLCNYNGTWQTQACLSWHSVEYYIYKQYGMQIWQTVEPLLIIYCCRPIRALNLLKIINLALWLVPHNQIARATERHLFSPAFLICLKIWFMSYDCLFGSN